MKALVDIQQVSKHFGAVRALHGVSLQLHAGEKLAFVGANGSGKTTLMRAMLGLLDMQGRVTIDGNDVRLRPELALRQVAYIPQVAPPLDAPVRELVRAQCGLRGTDPKSVADLAEQLGIDYGRIAGVRLRDLSGGTKQKILAALALSARSQILVCDEPTANLDEAARQAFFALVAKRPADSLLVLCSHRSEEVRQLVDRVVELREGVLVRDARLESVLGERALCRVQLKTQGEAPALLQAELMGLGFACVAPLTWRRQCNQAEKLALVSRVLEHRSHLGDLQVVDDERWSDTPHAAEAGAQPSV
jgi:ABC-type multidrug transport system ATPase subunit